MMVRIRYKTGTVRSVPAYVGKRLVERRIADYEIEVGKIEVAQDDAGIEETHAIDLEALSKEELYEFAVAKGLEPGPKTSAAKLRAMLQ